MTEFKLVDPEVVVEKPPLTDNINHLDVIHCIQDIDDLIKDCIDRGMEEWGSEMNALVNQTLDNSPFDLVEAILATESGVVTFRLFQIANNLGITNPKLHAYMPDPELFTAAYNNKQTIL